MPITPTYILTTDPHGIVAALYQDNVKGGHFTNGIYAAPADVVVPTTLAGFQFMTDKFADWQDALFIAVNSDVSVAGILDKKGAGADERAAMESQYDRAAKVAVPLAEQHPNRNVIILFYDDETPTRLYDELAMAGFEMKGLFKWGFGTKKDAPRIEGAHNFQNVVAFPFLNDDKAICHDITTCEDQSAFVQVEKLQDSTPDRPAYMTADSKLLFSLASSLQRFAPAGVSGTGAPAPTQG